MASLEHPSSSDLSALITARICHDLVSPVSAIGAALDVLEDPDAADMREDATVLARNAARQAWAKLEYIRIAFGFAGHRAGEVSLEEIKRLSEAMFASAKADVVWRAPAENLDRKLARVLMNAVLLGVEALPRGGVVTVETSPDGARMRLVCEGRRAKLTQAAIDALDGRAPEGGFDSRNVHPYFVGLIAREADGRIGATIDGERVEFTGLFNVSAPGALRAVG